MNHKKSTKLIYYLGGCYGTFVEWSCYYFLNHINYFPFTDSGSSHNYYGNFFLPTEKLYEYIASSEDNIEIGRCHPFGLSTEKSNPYNSDLSFLQVVDKNLSFLQDCFANKILVLYPTNNTKIWEQNNFFDKVKFSTELFETVYLPYGYQEKDMQHIFGPDSITRLKAILKQDKYKLDNVLQWDKKDIDQLENWELRELLSLYWEQRQTDVYSSWDFLKNKYPSILFISLDELALSIEQSMMKYLNFFDIAADIEKIKQIAKVWKPLQKNMNKDKIIDSIVNAIVNKENYDWSENNISFLDEIWIQKLLRDNNIEIRCYQLNKFPTNTKDFSKYVYTL